MADKDLVVVTGGSRGIGREAVLWFARRGNPVVLTYRRDPAAADAVVQESLRSGAPEAWAMPLDLTDPASIGRFARELPERFGTIPVLVNNAGVIVWGALEEQSAEEIRRQLDTNLVGVILLTQALLPYLRTVLNVGSDLATSGMADLVPYCAAKFGLRGFTQALAAERPDLRLLCVHPDRTATAMNDFQGRDPRLAAEVIGKAAEGVYGIPSGGDVNVWELIEAPLPEC
jgi:3-oxoacyl-[acyl-carrier protein] reductase